MRFEVSLVFAALLLITVIPFMIADIIRGSITLPFWQIIGSVYMVAIVLFAAMEYKLDKG